jgi:hypothetical protein
MNHLIFSKPDRRRVLSLCEDFKEVSNRTWVLLKNAFDYKFSIGEESITDINLLELQIRQPAALTTRKLSHHNENIIGADWLWAIVGRNGRTIVLYVQAKKYFPKSSRYESLIDSTNPFHQVDSLIANQFLYRILGIRMYPIYVFYNYFPGHENKIECNCGIKMDSGLAGCSYADALQIRSIISHGQNSYKDLYSIQYSLSCLVCCGSGTDLAINFFNQIISPDRLGTLLRQSNITDFNPENLLLAQPPEFVNQILANGEINEQQFSELNIGKIVVLDERRLEDNR